MCVAVAGRLTRIAVDPALPTPTTTSAFTEVVPLPILKETEWPTKDGSTGITSLNAINEAVRVGRALRAPSNLILFFCFTASRSCALLAELKPGSPLADHQQQHHQRKYRSVRRWRHRPALGQRRPPKQHRCEKLRRKLLRRPELEWL